jgi:NAD(P)-dependent dehydrogenase (short-subunit alcohol dehydrogenase family)
MGRSLRGKVAVDKGDGEGIGVAAARQLAAGGAAVFIKGRRQAALDKAVAEIGAVPLRRMSQTLEMGEFVAFLASDASGNITGVDIRADGGFAQV